MSKTDSHGLFLGILWSAGIGVVITLLALIATAGAVPRWAVVALGVIGFSSFSIAAAVHGWLKAPYSLGTPIRATLILGTIAAFMVVLCWTAWAPIKRHTLDVDEQALFEAPLKSQADEKDEIQLACPAADEMTCVYAAQFINLFREAGWKVQDSQVHRVTLGVPYEGIRVFSYVREYPPPDAPPNTGVWSKISKSLISVYRAFHAIGIEPEHGIRNDVKENVLTIYFGSERADESKPTQLTRTYGQLPAVLQENP